MVSWFEGLNIWDGSVGRGPGSDWNSGLEKSSFFHRFTLLCFVILFLKIRDESFGYVLI